MMQFICAASFLLGFTAFFIHDYKFAVKYQFFQELTLASLMVGFGAMLLGVTVAALLGCI